VLVVVVVIVVARLLTYFPFIFQLSYLKINLEKVLVVVVVIVETTKIAAA